MATCSAQWNDEILKGQEQMAFAEKKQNSRELYIFII